TTATTTRCAATTTTAATAFTFRTTRAALELAFTTSRRLHAVGHDRVGEVEVLAEVRDALVVEEPVEVAPRELLLDQVAAEQGAHQVRHVVDRSLELLATEGALPRRQTVLLAADHALCEEEAVHVIACLLRHNTRGHGVRGKGVCS